MIKKLWFKRTVALISALLVVCLAVLPTFAEDVTVTFNEVGYYENVTTQQQGNINSMFSSWRYLFANFYESSNHKVYYFELRNTIEGGNAYVPTNYQWYVPKSFNQSNFGVGNPIYRFYVPYNSGNKWIFQIRTELGNVVFDSSTAVFTQDSLDPYRGYFEFEWDRNILGNWWYIYSAYNAPLYSADEIPITFNYYYGNTYVESRQLFFPLTSYPIVINIPHIPDYLIQGGDQMYTSVVQSTVYNIDVKPFSVVLSEAEDVAFSDGYDQGLYEGTEDGYREGKADGESAGYQLGYYEGYQDGVDSAGGPTNPVETVTNPLALFLNPVVSFMNIQFLPGISIGVLFAAALTVAVIVIFLKIFAGG